MVLNYRVEDSQKLSHTGDQGNFFRLASGTEPLVKGFNEWIVASRDQGSHIKCTSYPPPSAPDRSFASHHTTIAVQRSYSRQCRYLMPVERPQFWQLSEQSSRQCRTYPGGALEQLILLSPSRTCPNCFSQLFFNLAQSSFHPSNMFLDVLFNIRFACRLQPAFLGTNHFYQLMPPCHYLLQSLGFGKRLRPGLHSPTILGYDLSIQSGQFLRAYL